MHIVLASASTVAASTAPWWGKVLVGFLLLVIGVVLSWMNHTEKISFGEYNDLLTYFLIMEMMGSFCVMLWGLGVNFN